MSREPFWPWDEGYDDVPDDDFLEDWSRDRQVDAWNYHQRGGNRCPHCVHGWHGLPCAAGPAHSPCPCPTSFEKAP